MKTINPDLPLIIKNTPATRNIININEINDTIKSIVTRKPSCEEYIKHNLRNYLIKSAPYLNLQTMNKLSKEEKNIVKKNKTQIFHTVLINEDTISEIEHVLDFITSKNQQNNLRLSYKDALKTTHIADDKRKYAKKEVEGEIKDFKIFPNGMKIVQLIDEQSFKRESFLMRHCVADYFELYSNLQSTLDKWFLTGVFSLRTIENKPLITMEIKRGKLVQIKGFANKVIDLSNTAEYKDVIDFLQLFRIKKNRKLEQRNTGIQNRLSHSPHPVILSLQFIGLLFLLFIITSTFIRIL